MPMTFDQHSRCSYNCLYCFSYFQRALKCVNPNQNQGGERKLYLYEEPEPVNVNSIRKLFSGETNNMFSGYIRDRLWMQWGGLSDPFDEFERQLGTGLELLKVFDELRYPICFSTKGTWWVYDDRYMSLFVKNRDIWNVKMSVINLNSALAGRIELGCPSPEDRLLAVRQLTANGIGVTLRLRPFVIGMSDLDGEHLELIRRAANAGVRAVSTEFFCLERRMSPGSRERFERMSEALGLDVVDFYRRNTPNATGYMRLNWKIKEPYVDEMERVCRHRRVRFYVSDAHHKDRCATGSCCGLRDEAHYARGQFTYAIVYARKNGRVHFSDIARYFPPCYHEIRAIEAVNFMRGSPSQRARFHSFTVADMFRFFWNNPNESKSPYRYFGGALRPLGLDDNQDVIYEYRGYRE